MPSEVGRESSRCSTCQSPPNQRIGHAGEPRNFRREGLIAQISPLARFSHSRCTNFQLKTAYSHLDDFCKLPEDTKELYLRDSESGNHGYVRPGQERFDGKTKDIRHAYNICTLNLKLPEEVIVNWADIWLTFIGSKNELLIRLVT